MFTLWLVKDFPGFLYLALEMLPVRFLLAACPLLCVLFFIDIVLHWITSIQLAAVFLSSSLELFGFWD